MKLPTHKFTVEAHFPLDKDKSIEVVNIKGPEAGLAAELVRASDRVEVQESSVAGDEARVRMVVHGCYLPHAVQSSLVIPSMPYEVRDGGHRWMLVGPDKSLRAFVDKLRELGATVDVLHAGELRGESLTPRQQEVLDLAVARGYYDFPRRTSQSEMAEELGVSRAAVSEMLMVIENKVIAGTVGKGKGAKAHL